MTIDLYSTSPDDGLFNLLGKTFHAQATINTARGTTIPAEIDDAIESFNLLPVNSELEELAGTLSPLSENVKGIGSGQMSALSGYARDLLIAIVNQDDPQPDGTLATALAELIRQMEAGAASLDASTVGISVTPGAGNTGDGVILTTTKRGDGRIAELMLAEDVEAEATSDGLTASIRLAGEQSVPLLDARWPQGSGAARSISAVDAAASVLLLNGDFEDEDDIANAPDDWIVSVGTIGTTLKMTDVEVQTVALSGSPSSGTYRISWANAAGEVQTTVPIAYDATASTVQAALRRLVGLELVTVATTGSAPNLTHTITFTGRGGNLNQVTVTNLTNGTITPGTTSAGTAQVFAGGKALELDSDGSQLTTINQQIAGLAPETAYAISLWGITDSVPAAGVLAVDLVDGIGGTVIRDAQGMLNSLAFNADDLTTAWQHLSELVAAVNEVQTLTITGTPDGGDFTLAFDGVTTGAIAYNADAATVQAALVALSNVNTGDVTCGGGALPGTPVTITFGGRFAGRAMPLITADGGGLTGGSAPAAAVALTTLGSPAECVFRTPAVVPDVVYLRIRIAVAVSNTSSVFIDHAALSRMAELYPGGPWVAAFSGATPFKRGDVWTLATTNDRAGLLQEWCHRNFDFARLGVLLPTDAAGSESVPDSVVGA